MSNPREEPTITLEDVARHCGVGRSTVSRALIGDPHVHPATRTRIQEAAQAIGYNPARHEAARRMALRRTGRDVTNYVIGFLVPLAFERAAYFSRMFHGVMGILSAEGYALVVAYSEDRAEQTRPLPPIFFRGEIDGLIAVANPVHTGPIVTQLRREPGFGARPVVTMINPVPGCAGVLNDDADGAYQATRHLLDLGHRHILHFTYERFGTIDGRLQGTRRAMAEAGIDPETHLFELDLHAHAATRHWYNPTQEDEVSHLPEEAQEFSSEHPVLQALRAHPQISAILALNDPSALRAWYLLNQVGLRVPEDISIIGFDDVEAMPDTHGANQLTTVRLPLPEVGRAAARLLIRHITGHAGEEERVVLPTTLVVRGSTGPPRGVMIT